MVKFLGKRIENMLPFILGSALAIPFNTAINYFVLDHNFDDGLTRALFVFLITNLMALVVYIIAEFLYFSYFAHRYTVPLGVVYYTTDELETPWYKLPDVLGELKQLLITLYSKRKSKKL